MAAAALGLILAASLAAQQQAEPKPLKTSVKAIAAAPAKFLGKYVAVEGTLANEGRNYFTDLRVVLKEKSGEKIYVRPWLPMEAPPGPGGRTRTVLSKFLNQRVELKGTFEKGELRGVGDTYLLAVKEARILR